MNEITEPQVRHVVLDREDAAQFAEFIGEMADGLRAQDADTLAEALEGIAEEFVVTHRGRPVARLVAAESSGESAVPSTQ